MIGDEPQQGSRRYFNFNVQVPDSGNIPKDKAELRIRFEKALDELYECKPSPQIQLQHELQRL